MGVRNRQVYAKGHLGHYGDSGQLGSKLSELYRVSTLLLIAFSGIACSLYVLNNG